MHSLEQSLIAEVESVGPLTVQDIQRVFSALTPPDVAGLVERMLILKTAFAAEGDHFGMEVSEAFHESASTITHLAAENALLREREGWKPIETAPKDGTVVLCGWFEDDGTVYAVAGWYEAGIADCRWYDQYDDAIEPTHWMPLPASPSHQEQNNG